MLIKAMIIALPYTAAHAHSFDPEAGVKHGEEYHSSKYYPPYIYRHGGETYLPPQYWKHGYGLSFSYIPYHNNEDVYIEVTPDISGHNTNTTVIIDPDNPQAAYIGTDILPSNRAISTEPSSDDDISP